MQNPKHDHGAALAHFRKQDPKIYTILEKTNLENWFERRSDLQYFESLCRSIIGQQLSVKAAETIWKRFHELFTERPITPQLVLEAEEATFRGVGLSGSKSQYVKNIATAFEKKQITTELLATADDETVIEHLVQIKGIGRWTAEMFLMFTLARPNIFSMGDLGLKKGFALVYEIENPTPEHIQQVISRWEPYRTYGSIALWERLV